MRARARAACARALGCPRPPRVCVGPLEGLRGGLDCYALVEREWLNKRKACDSSRQHHRPPLPPVRPHRHAHLASLPPSALCPACAWARVRGHSQPAEERERAQCRPAPRPVRAPPAASPPTRRRPLARHPRFSWSCPTRPTRSRCVCVGGAGRERGTRPRRSVSAGNRDVVSLTHASSLPHTRTHTQSPRGGRGGPAGPRTGGIGPAGPRSAGRTAAPALPCRHVGGAAPPPPQRRRLAVNLLPGVVHAVPDDDGDDNDDDDVILVSEHPPPPPAVASRMARLAAAARAALPAPLFAGVGGGGLGTGGRATGPPKRRRDSSSGGGGGGGGGAAAAAAAQAAAAADAAVAPKCGICLDPIRSMACGPCGHAFCEACLRAALSKTKKCPSCRRAMQLRQVHRVFL